MSLNKALSLKNKCSKSKLIEFIKIYNYFE